MDKYIVAPPNGSTNNSVGAADRPWEEGHFEKLPNWQEYLAESTGYGIASGCKPTISGLTVTVGAGVAHLADGTRKEISATNITLDNADPTNPRIDIVYITADGDVAKITGTAAASPSTPALPTGGISVCNVTVAAGATTGVVTDKRKMLNPCFIYDSVASMMADNLLRVGDVTRTLGYYASNDGGGAIYRIVDTTQFLSESLNNGLYAELIVEDTLNLKQIGAKSRDSSFDNSPILKSAIEFALSSKKYSTIYIPSGYYTFTTTIDLLSENKSLSVINLVGDGENWNGNASGTVISYYGANDTYLFDFGEVSRCLFKRLLFTGSGSNKCFSIKNCYVTRFEDVQLQDFANAVWLREYCAYVYFDHCMFNCARNGTQGLIINTHYTDGREYTQQYNAEYIYITDCAFDAGDDLSNHVVVYGCHFLWISRCDFCNSADVSILIDTSGWKSNILDVFIDSMSFCRNKIATKIIKGNGQAGRIKINGSWTRKNQSTVDDRILVTEGDGAIYQLELSGRCEPYNSATYGIDAINAHMVNHIIGDYHSRASQNEAVYLTYPSTVRPRYYRVVVPVVTTSGNKVTYDFSAYGETNRFLSVCGGGIIGGTNGECMVAFEFIHCYGSKITGNTGANISDVTIRGKAITVTCAYNPNTYIGDMSFYALL